MVRGQSLHSAKGYKGLGMEGFIATWYAKISGKDQYLEELKNYAKRAVEHVRLGSRVLEVAPGPGYLAIELAKLSTCTIVGLDISRSFVRIAADNAAKAGVQIEFRQGDAAAMPFNQESFDFIVCRAAFKNFMEPIGALREMHRVLKVGGTALIVDLRNDVTDEAIDNYVDHMGVSRTEEFIIKWTFKLMLRRRAYSKQAFVDMIAQTPFVRSDIQENPLGFEVWLEK